MMEDRLYFYSAKCYYVTDGDTIKAHVNLGYNIMIDVTIRFMGINTPETRTRDLDEKKKGFAAKQRLIDILKINEYNFYLKSHGVGKFGRCLGEVFVEKLPDSESEELISVNKQLISEGHAVEYYGGKRK